jgi:hypothetical protein
MKEITSIMLLIILMSNIIFAQSTKDKNYAFKQNWQGLKYYRLLPHLE